MANDFEASASMSLNSGPRTEARGLELVTYGARITPVKSVSDIFGHSKIPWHSGPEIANEIWVEAFDHLEASTPDPTGALYALSTLLTAGQGWTGRAIQDREQHFADLLAFMYDPAMLSNGDIAVGRSARDSRTGGTPLGHPNKLVDSLFRPRTDLVLPLDRTPRYGNNFQRAMIACRCRRLVITEDGHVGLGPEVTEPGDVVCILKDAAVPLVLRSEPDSDRFKLVGEAYVEGMMFGEIKISEVEQIVLSDKPFVDLVETEH